MSSILSYSYSDDLCYNSNIIIFYGWPWNMYPNMTGLWFLIRHRSFAKNFTLSASLDRVETHFQLHLRQNQCVPCTVHSKIFIKIEFKIRSHCTIHTFKNYFTTIFSVFSNNWYPNRPLLFFFFFSLFGG